MMVSPETYRSFLQDKNYEELIKERDSPIDEIKEYEQISDDKSKYKIHRVGEALAWEYLRNVGIDGMKSDVHLCRFFLENV